MSWGLGRRYAPVALAVLAAAIVTTGSGLAADTAVRPSISSVAPLTVKPLASLTIKGAHFVHVKTVKIGGVAATFKVRSATQITVTVPAKAKTGRIVITTQTGSATSGASVTVKTGSPVVQSPVVLGRAVFKANCSVCHGVDGTGGEGGPDLRTQPLAQTVAGVIKQVTNGGGGMPSFGGQLTKQQIEDVAAFVTQEIVK